ncbi:hypothetical protein OPQ81_002576 [Rhizoctonia solani]|nr:hypothetical protein OPQ81_002576 [Rhizoctonia solani]
MTQLRACTTCTTRTTHAASMGRTACMGTYLYARIAWVPQLCASYAPQTACTASLLLAIRTTQMVYAVVLVAQPCKSFEDRTLSTWGYATLFLALLVRAVIMLQI